MFSITNKLDKSEIKYDLMEDEKCNPTESQTVDYDLRKSTTNGLIYIILIGVAFTTAAWLMVGLYLFISTSENFLTLTMISNVGNLSVVIIA